MALGPGVVLLTQVTMFQFKGLCFSLLYPSFFLPQAYKVDATQLTFSPAVQGYTNNKGPMLYICVTAFMTHL